MAQVGAPVAAQTVGNISGTVIDVDGALATGARVALTMEGSSEKRQTVVDEEGRYSFSGVATGKFSLTVTSDGLAPGTATGALEAGQNLQLPEITLKVATASTDIEVTLTTEELAQSEIKVEESQRLFGFAPNFYVSYTFNAAPLSPKQKWELAYKSTIDPMTFVIVGGFAGIQQANNTFPGFGEGAQGYAKRYGSTFANVAIGTALGGALFPIWFHQDPRYFYKGTGTKWSRARYALSTSVIARGDNGKWQPAYAGILAGFAAGGISNVYYAPEDRQGATLTIENGLLGIAFTGVGNLMQEFLFRKASSHVPKAQGAP